jgi:hypothetical protein
MTTQTLCPPCIRGSHDRCWKTWANMNINDLTMGQDNECACETCFPAEALPS